MSRQSAVVELEPDGGNLYKRHELMVHSGSFWRCTHGLTGFSSDANNDLVWVGCTDCAKADFAAWRRWEAKNITDKDRTDYLQKLGGKTLRDKIDKAILAEKELDLNGVL